MWLPASSSESEGLWHRTPPWMERELKCENSVPFWLLVQLQIRVIQCTLYPLQATYFCCVSPARMRILCTSMLPLFESPDHQDETIFSMFEADHPLVSSHLNFSISRSPMSFSVTSRNECVLFDDIFSFLPIRGVEIERCVSYQPHKQWCNLTLVKNFIMML